MTITNLDVTALFPFPGELAAQPMERVSAAPATTEPTNVMNGAHSGAPLSTKPAELSAESLTENLQKLNAGLQRFGIEFEVSDIDNRLITRVVDSETGELIRQIPSEEVLRIARSLTQTTGLLLNISA
ncbi:flagellar protein FlaG [compost metagenome]